jgi:uncharacterized membrane protein
LDESFESGRRALLARPLERNPRQLLYYRAMLEARTPVQPETRHARTESARLDNFVDGAFAFAITLLVISGASLPKDITALEHALRGVPAFAACFAQLAWFWHAHVRWRDNVQLTDKRSLLLSLLLVFFALIFVFPLHLFYSVIFKGMSGGALSPDVANSFTSYGGLVAFFTCYGFSYACMAGTLALLYRHGVQASLRMDRESMISIRVWSVVFAYVAVVGLISALLALAVPHDQGWLNALPGYAYFLLVFTRLVARRRRQRLDATLPP